MSSRPLELYFVRFAEIANITAILFVWWQLGYRPELYAPQDPIQRPVLLICAAPFLIAFLILLQSEPTTTQWHSIRAIHQALAIVTGAVGAILLIGLPDTRVLAVYIGIIALLQVIVLRVSRRFVFNSASGGPKPITVLRVSMILLFAFTFIVMK